MVKPSTKKKKGKKWKVSDMQTFPILSLKVKQMNQTKLYLFFFLSNADEFVIFFLFFLIFIIKSQLSFASVDIKSRW